MTDETKDSTPPLDERIFNDRDLSARSLLRNLAPSLLINAVLPFLLYQYLTAHQVSTVNALSATAVFPIAGITLGWVRTRRLDIIGVISLIFIVPGLLTSLISGSPQFFLIKESVLTGLFGLSFLGSLLLPRPLMFYLSRQFYSGGDPSRAARFEERWQFPSFRFSQRLMTVVWGCVLIGEALIRVGLVFVLPIPIFLEISPVMAATIILGLSIWTMSYARAGSRSPTRRGDASWPGNPGFDTLAAESPFCEEHCTFLFRNEPLGASSLDRLATVSDLSLMGCKLSAPWRETR